MCSSPESGTRSSGRVSRVGNPDRRTRTSLIAHITDAARFTTFAAGGLAGVVEPGPISAPHRDSHR